MTSWTLGFGGFTEVMMKMGKTVEDMPGWWFRWVPICFMYLYVLICSSMFYCTWYLVLVNKVLNCQIFFRVEARFCLRRGSWGFMAMQSFIQASEISHGARSHPSQNQVPRGQRCFFWLVVYRTHPRHVDGLPSVSGFWGRDPERYSKRLNSPRNMES